MQRRHFLQSTAIGALGALGALDPRSAHSQTASPDEARAFASSFTHTDKVLGGSHVHFNKSLPKGLRGVLYRNGPAQMVRGQTRMQHWFDGDGMVHRFALQGQTLTHASRMVQTTRYKAEMQAGRYLWPSFGTDFPDSRPPAKPDDVNTANVSVLPLQDEVLALWEGGSPWRLDGKTLETKGRKVFSADTDGVSFSAHPRIDPDGRIWNVGYQSGSGKLLLWDLGKDGTLNRVQMVDTNKAEMVHDFAMTQNYLVLILFPIVLTGKPWGRVLERMYFDRKQSVDVLLISKSSLEVVQRFEAPAFFSFHFGNAWEDEKTVRVQLVSDYRFESLMQSIEDATQAKPLSARMDSLPTGQMVLELGKTSAKIERNDLVGLDFPTFDPRFAGLKTHHHSFMAVGEQLSKQILGFNRVVHLDTQRQRVQHFDYGAHVLAEEHIFVPRPNGAEGEGWLLGTSYNWRQQRSALNVFDAKHVAAGPLAQAQLPYGLPLGLHGKFVLSRL